MEFVNRAWHNAPYDYGNRRTIAGKIFRFLLSKKMRTSTEHLLRLTAWTEKVLYADAESFDDYFNARTLELRVHNLLSWQLRIWPQAATSRAHASPPTTKVSSSINSTTTSARTGTGISNAKPAELQSEVTDSHSVTLKLELTTWIAQAIKTTKRVAATYADLLIARGVMNIDKLKLRLQRSPDWLRELSRSGMDIEDADLIRNQLLPQPKPEAMAPARRGQTASERENPAQALLPPNKRPRHTIVTANTSATTPSTTTASSAADSHTTTKSIVINISNTNDKTIIIKVINNSNSNVNTTAVMNYDDSTDAESIADATSACGNADNKVRSDELESSNRRSADSTSERDQWMYAWSSLLQHAALCKHDPRSQKGPCPIDRRCATMKKLYLHIVACKDKNCKVPHCLQAKNVLSHNNICSDMRPVSRSDP